jgi:hypothetical protein
LTVHVNGSDSFVDRNQPRTNEISTENTDRYEGHDLVAVAPENPKIMREWNTRLLQVGLRVNRRRNLILPRGYGLARLVMHRSG